MQRVQPDPQPLSSLNKGYLICLVGTVLWSATAVFIRYLTETFHMPALALAFWRDSLVSLALVITFFLTNRSRLRLERRQLPFLLLYGLVLSLFNATWTFSVALNGAAISTVLVYSSAGFTAVIGWRFFGERLGVVKLTAVGLSLIGCALVSGALDPTAWQLNPLGVITGLLSGLAFAAYGLFGKTASQRGMYSWTTLLYTFGFAALFLLGYNLIFSARPFADLFILGSAADGWGVLVLLALVPTIGGYGLYTLSLDYLPTSVANLIATLEPAFTAVMAYLLLGERYTATQGIGSLLLITGVLALRLQGQRQPTRRRVAEGSKSS